MRFPAGLLAPGPRLARVLALLGVALLALALAAVSAPGAADAAAPGAAATARQAPADEGDDVADDAADDDAVADDDPADDEDAADDGDLSEDDLGDDDEDEAPLVLVVDRRGRALESPKVLAATKTARGTNLRWKAWGAATATGSGRLAFRTTGRRGKAVKGAGTVRLSRLLVCDDGTAVYRRATLAVPHRGRLVATLPGCPASDD